MRRTAMLRAVILVSIAAKTACLVLPPVVLQHRTRLESAPTLDDLAPSWEALDALLAKSATGRRLAREAEARATGLGPPHADASTRLFGGDASSIRAVAYVDRRRWE